MACLCLGHFLAFFDRFLFAAAAPLAAHDLDLDDLQLGVLLGPAFALVYGIAAVAFGVWLPRRVRLAMLIGGLALWTLASAATSLAQGFVGLTVARMAVAIGEAAFVPIALTLIVDLAAARRARALAWFTSGATLGRCLALLGGGGLLALLSAHAIGGGLAGWRLLYAVTVLPNLLLLVLLLVIVLPAIASASGPVSAGRAEPSPAQEPAGPWLARNAGPVAFATLIAVTSVAAGQTMASWLPLLLVRLHGLTASAAAMTVGGLTLVATPLGHFCGSLLIERRPTRPARAALLNFAGLVGVVLGVALLAFGEGRVALAGIAIAEFAVGVATFAGLFGFQSIVPAGVRGPVNALFLATTTFVGVGLGPLLVGVLSYSGLSRGIGGALLATTALCAVIAAAGMPGLRRSPATAG